MLHSSSPFTPTALTNTVFKSEAKGLMVHVGVPDNLRAFAGEKRRGGEPSSNEGDCVGERERFRVEIGGSYLIRWRFN